MAVAGQTDDVPLNRDQVILRMVQFARSGRIPEAQEVLRTYLQDNSTDGTMHYNLACLDLLLKQKDQAMIDLENALKNGYTNFRLIEVDADLDLLRDNPDFEPLIKSYQTSFLKEFHSRALYLDDGYPSPKLDLQLQSTAGGNLKPQASVAFNARELLVTLSVDDPSYIGEKPPWENGSGVLVNLIHPISPDDYDSRRYYSYGFFVRDGQAQATLVGRHKEVLLQPIPQLKPVITRQGNVTTYQMTLPWEYFEPYAPSFDPEMGLNILYFSAGESSSQDVYSLMPEKELAFKANSWRRFIPVSFLESDRSVATLRGRLYNRLTEGVELGVQLAFWSEAEGESKCRFSFHTQKDPSAFVDDEIDELIFCESELNFFNFYLNISGLPNESLILRAEITDPNERTFTRDFLFDNFQENWLGQLNQRVHQLKNSEQSTLKYHLFLLTRLAEHRHPQSNASHIHEAYAKMVKMIELSEAGETCLPDQGLFHSGFNTDSMTMRYCSIYLPKGFKQAKKLKLLMVLPPEPQTEDQVANSLGHALAGSTDTIVLVPQSHGYSSLNAQTAAEETVLAMKWATSLFDQKTVTLVGLGNGADATLGASLLGPEFCDEILLDGHQLYRDMEDFTSARVGEALGTNLNQLPYTIISSAGTSERSQLIKSTMNVLGFQIQVVSLDQKSLDIPWLTNWYLTRK